MRWIGWIFTGTLLALFSTTTIASAANSKSPSVQNGDLITVCETELQTIGGRKAVAKPKPIQSEHEAYQILSQALPRLFDPDWLNDQAWYQLLETFALPASDHQNPFLVSTILGGGNAGKSTLMNSLPGLLSGQTNIDLQKLVSHTGYYPGLTKRMVIGVNPSALDGPYEEDLQSRYGRIDAWTSADSSRTEGPGLLVSMDQIPEHLAFIDSPDFDTGEAGEESPDNLNRALQVICPSDVLILMFNPQTIRNQANIKLLHRVFKTYGFKQTILIFWADPAMPEEEADRLLVNVAQGLYETKDDNYPAAVLGAYLMPYDTGVPRNERLPELRPLRDYPDFATLVESMNKDSLRIKQFALRNARATIQKDLSREVRAYIKSRMATTFYLYGIKALSENVARSSVQEFPYTSLRDEIFRRYQRLRNTLIQLAHGTGSWIAVPEKRLANFISEVLRTSPRSSDFVRELEDDHRMHDRLAVTDLILQLQKGVLSFDADEQPISLKRLNDFAKKFYKIFPEERPKVLSEKDIRDASIRIPLPRKALLAPYALEAFDKLLNTNTEVLTRELSVKLDSAQFDPNLSMASRKEIYLALEGIHQNQSPLSRSRNALFDTLALAAPAGVTYAMAIHGINNTLLYLAAINLASRPFYMWNVASQERFLRRRLSSWFFNIQYEITNQFFETNVTHELTRSLNAPHAAQDRALDEVQRALRYLNP